MNTHPLADKEFEGHFAPTRWSLVARAGKEGGSEEDRLSALQELLKLYLPALRAHVAAKMSLPPAQAEDIVQGFVADRILGRNLLAAADRRRGRLRSLLRVAIERYAISWLRSPEERRSRRGIPLDTAQADETGEGLVVRDAPGCAMDVEWARAMLGEAVNRMRNYCTRNRRDDLWFIFEQRLLRPCFADATPLAYDRIVAELRLVSPSQAFNLLATAKRAFGRALVSVVSEYAGTEADVDTEIRELRSILRDASEDRPPFAASRGG